jgi:hypothetical protein
MSTYLSHRCHHLTRFERRGLPRIDQEQHVSTRQYRRSTYLLTLRRRDIPGFRSGSECHLCTCSILCRRKHPIRTQDPQGTNIWRRFRSCLLRRHIYPLTRRARLDRRDSLLVMCSSHRAQHKACIRRNFCPNTALTGIHRPCWGQSNDMRLLLGPS